MVGTQRVLAAALAGLVAIAGCTTSPRVPQLGAIYNRAAQHHGPFRNPIIVIPGIVGSRLRDARTGRTIWGAFDRDYADPTSPAGARVVALPMREGVPLRELRDDVVPDGVLDKLRVRLFGLPVQLKAYFEILATLGAGGFRDQSVGLLGAIDYGRDHFTCFQFPYDWRRDNVENAVRLHQFILEKGAYVREEIRRRYGVDRDVKFDIVAHSMGGLIARYYRLYGAADLPSDGSTSPITWAGLRYVDRVILVGTPDAGSVDALMQLVNGSSVGRFLPWYGPAILGTFPSVYQLLPRTRHGALVESDEAGAPRADVLDPGLWERMGWGLASRDQDRILSWLLPEIPDPATRRRIALDHQRKCFARAQQLFTALDQPEPPHEGGDLFLVAGDAAPTSAVAALRGANGRLAVVRWEPGDGTVLRSSALLDERVGGTWSPTLVSPIVWRGATFLFSDHLGMTRDPAFADNVLYLLLEDRR
ncbi:MAG: hypothetical protein U0807_09925 [Candidatus Binatia bacterium]